MSQHDYQMAVLLQKQFEYEASLESPTNSLAYASKKNKNAQDRSKSLTDPSWELVDPTPDIHMLFIAFNEKYFWNKLVTVCVDWSKRMTTCAGICSYQGRGGMCRITLSEPLLKLRPRKDLVETLLHEMIHAYLFVTHNNKDRDGHGPEFHKHMYRINSDAGTNITVYHDFHDEVRLYKQHWWRCDGPCQQRKPYFGMVRRATNRAPGPNDFWWGEHQRSCGGTFIKVQEPPKVVKNKSSKENKPNSKNDIRKFYPVVNSDKTNQVPGGLPPNSNIKSFKDLNGTKPRNALANSSSTIVINKKPTSKKDNEKQTDTAKSKAVAPKQSSIIAFSGTGRSLSDSSAPPTDSDYNAVRNHWTNKFTNVSKPAKRISSSNSKSSENSKRVKHDLPENNDYVTCPVCQKQFPPGEIDRHLDDCLEEQSKIPEFTNQLPKCPVCDQEYEIGVMNSHVEECLSKVFIESEEPTEDIFRAPEDLIPCLVCNKRVPRSNLNSHLDDCMWGNNIFNNSSGTVSVDEDNDVFNGDVKTKEEDKKYNCPVCFQLFSVNEMTEHLDKCLWSDDEASNSFLNEPF